MLQTIAKIGEQLLEGKGIWARLTAEPKFDPDKKNWVCPILFDCANKEIRVLKEEMELFKPEESPIKYRFVKATRKGPRQSKFDLTVERDDLKNLQESLFGKGKKPPGCLNVLESSLPNALDSKFGKKLQTIKKTLGHISTEVEEKNIKEELGDVFKSIVFFVAKVKSNNQEKPYYLFEHDEFLELTKRVFKRHDPLPGISYIDGKHIANSVEAQFWSRYNVHKIFQTSSYNYATGFKQNNFRQNFQGSDEDFDRLDRASRYILNNLQTRIAGVSHIIIPHFRNVDLNDFDLKETELYLNKSSDLLFGYLDLDKEIDNSFSHLNLFWVNYIAFESDGNSFKIMNHIKDVNSHYLIKLIELFFETEMAFRDFIGWKHFNLRSIFNIIPVRDGKKSNINPVLSLFKEILEQKRISKESLFHHFIELALCHWYERYTAFKNVNSKFKSFDFAIKDAVFKYSALFYTLKQLNLLDMENEINPEVREPNKTGSDYKKRIQAFFEKMEYSEAEKALFYLGRVLSSIAYAQYKKGHESKPVLNKINFNGMDTDAIVRLSLDLREKTQQYSIHNKTEWDLSEFTERFNEKNWPLSKEQNVFYLMAGYSFGLTKSNNNQ